MNIYTQRPSHNIMNEATIIFVLEHYWYSINTHIILLHTETLLEFQHKYVTVRGYHMSTHGLKF